MRRGPRPQYGSSHRRTSEALIAEHVDRHGWMCPGIDGIEDAHPARHGSLVTDHLVAGRPELGYRVVCRIVNSRRRALGLG